MTKLVRFSKAVNELLEVGEGAQGHVAHRWISHWDGPCELTSARGCRSGSGITGRATPCAWTAPPPGCEEHVFLCGVLETMLVADRINISPTSRRYMVDRPAVAAVGGVLHPESLRSVDSGDAGSYERDERWVFLGTRRATRLDRARAPNARQLRHRRDCGGAQAAP